MVLTESRVHTGFTSVRDLPYSLFSLQFWDGPSLGSPVTAVGSSPDGQLHPHHFALELSVAPRSLSRVLIPPSIM